jgi:DNA-binding response OmpR family regulator
MSVKYPHTGELRSPGNRAGVFRLEPMNYALSSIRIPNGNPHERVKVLLEQMKIAALAGNEDKAENCSLIIETLTAAYMDSKAFPLIEIDGIGLTNRERRVLDLLKSRPEQCFPRSAIMNALYFDKPDGDWPDPKIIDVFICKMRRKLEGTPHDVRTIWGRGYQYHAQTNAQRAA